MVTKQTQHTVEEEELQNAPLLMQYMDEAMAAMCQPARGIVRYRLDFFNSKEQKMNCSYDAYALRILWSLFLHSIGVVDDGLLPHQREVVERLKTQGSVTVDIPVGAGK